MTRSERHEVDTRERSTKKKNGAGASSFREHQADGRIPKSIKIDNQNFLPDYEVDAIVRVRIRGLDDHAIRLRVDDLEAARATLCVDPVVIRGSQAEAA